MTGEVKRRRGHAKTEVSCIIEQIEWTERNRRTLVFWEVHVNGKRSLELTSGFIGSAVLRSPSHQTLPIEQVVARALKRCTAMVLQRSSITAAACDCCFRGTWGTKEEQKNKCFFLYVFVLLTRTSSLEKHALKPEWSHSWADGVVTVLKVAVWCQNFDYFLNFHDFLKLDISTIDDIIRFDQATFSLNVWPSFPHLMPHISIASITTVKSFFFF